MGGTAFTRVATFNSGEVGIMGVTFDESSGYLWTICDALCDGRTNVLAISKGKFSVIAKYDRPSSMGNYNTEVRYAMLCRCDLSFA